MKTCIIIAIPTRTALRPGTMALLLRREACRRGRATPEWAPKCHLPRCTFPLIKQRHQRHENTIRLILIPLIPKLHRDHQILNPRNCIPTPRNMYNRIIAIICQKRTKHLIHPRNTPMNPSCTKLNKFNRSIRNSLLSHLHNQPSTIFPTHFMSRLHRTPEP